LSELVEEEEGHHGRGGEAGAEGDVIHDVVGESSDQSAMGTLCQVDS
jgi:hypothetical protein